MATRPNKRSSSRPVRKPTVAGRKRTVQSPGVESPVETPTVETPTVEEPTADTSTAETPKAAAPTADAPVDPTSDPAPEATGAKTSLVKPDDAQADVDDFEPVDGPDSDVESDSAATESDAESTSVKPSGKSARRPVSRVSTIRAGGATTAATKTEEPAPRRLAAAGAGIRNASSSVRSMSFVNWHITSILAGAAVVLAIIAGLLAWHPGGKIDDNRAFVDTSATTDVLTQGRSKVCAPFAYEVNGYDKWVQTARVALTGQALDEFNKNIEAQKQIVQQSNSSVECRLDTVGVQRLTGDHAVLIASLVLSRNVNGSVLDSQTARVQANMVKIGDSWLMERLYQL